MMTIMWKAQSADDDGWICFLLGFSSRVLIDDGTDARSSF